MKRILFIINSFSAGGGAESLLTTIVNKLNKKKYEISVIEILHHDIKTEPVDSNITVLPYIMRADDPERKTKMYSFYHEWDKVIKKYIPDNFDVYVSFNYLKPSFLLPKGKKNIAWIHSDIYDLLSPNKQEERELQKEAFENVETIVSISDKTYQSILDVCNVDPKKLIKIYNGVDVKLINEKAHESTKVRLHSPSILVIGRLDERKNPWRAYQIFKKMMLQDINCDLYFLGYGVLEEKITRAAEEDNISDKIHMLGYEFNPFPIIRQANVVLMTSLSEGFPMALLEAVSLGVPFVSTEVGGAKELSQDGLCGSVFESDEQAIKEILFWLRMDKEQISRNCEKGISKFQLHKYIERIEALFDGS